MECREPAAAWCSGCGCGAWGACCAAGALAALPSLPDAWRSATSSDVCRDSSLPQLPGGSLLGGCHVAQAGGAGAAPLPAAAAGGMLLAARPSCVHALSTDPARNIASWLMQGLRLGAGWGKIQCLVSPGPPAALLQPLPCLCSLLYLPRLPCGPHRLPNACPSSAAPP